MGTRKEHQGGGSFSAMSCVQTCSKGQKYKEFQGKDDIERIHLSPCNMEADANVGTGRGAPGYADAGELGGGMKQLDRLRIAIRCWAEGESWNVAWVYATNVVYGWK